MDSAAPADSRSRARPDELAAQSAGLHPWAEWEFWAVVLVVGAIYFGQLTALPICGEERAGQRRPGK